MPEWFYLVAVTLFGLIIGSFLNVVIYRFHTSRSLNDRSHCMSCGKTLSWYELFPVFSYLALRGRCSSCSSFIPYRYALVELLTALLFLLAYLKTSDWLLLSLLFIFLSTLVVVLVYDLYHMIIPDELSLVLTVVALSIIGYQSVGWSHFFSSLLAGVAVALLFASLWWFSRGRAMGFGDAKLAVSLGMLVGATGVFSLVVWSFWIGALVSVALLLMQKFMQKRVVRRLFGRVNMKSEVPFAPFLIASFLLVYFFNAGILTFIETIFQSV